eukprot:206517_1
MLTCTCESMIKQHETCVKTNKIIKADNIQLIIMHWLRILDILMIQHLISEIWKFYNNLPIFNSFPLFHSNLTVETNSDSISIAHKTHDTYFRTCTFGEAIFPVKNRIYSFVIRVDIGGRMGLCFLPNGYTNTQQPPWCFDKCLTISNDVVWNSDWLDLNDTLQIMEQNHSSIFKEKGDTVSVYIDGISNIIKIECYPTEWVSYVGIPNYYNDENKFGIGFTLFSGEKQDEITQLSIIKQQWR